MLSARVTLLIITTTATVGVAALTFGKQKQTFLPMLTSDHINSEDADEEGEAVNTLLLLPGWSG